jgi:hypothetical protein
MPRSQRARDDGQQSAIRAILSELPEDHPARAAHRGGADAIELTHLVGRDDLAEKLSQAWLDWYTARVRRARRR